METKYFKEAHDMKYKLLKEAVLREMMEDDSPIDNEPFSTQTSKSEDGKQRELVKENNWHKEHTLIDPTLPGGGHGTYEFDPNGDVVDYEPDERDPDYFCTDCYDENCDTKTLRGWAEVFQEDGDLPSDIDLDQFDDNDRVCYKCAKKALRTSY